MSQQQKSTDVEHRLGVYKTIDDVPERRRLYQYADSYAGNSVWREFRRHEIEELGYDSETTARESRRVFREWREHMEDRGPHFALPEPLDVEAFFTDILGKHSVKTAYAPYWVRLDAFFEYLLWHRHPHVYNPLKMAVVQYDGATRAVWSYKITSHY